jgi:hypothetical protein
VNGPYKQSSHGEQEWSNDQLYHTWWLTFREKRRLWVFEKRVLRKIFGPKRDEVTEEWRTLHNEELIDLYASLNIVRV